MGCEQSLSLNESPIESIRKEKRKINKVHGRVSGNTQFFENVTIKQSSLPKDDKIHARKIISKHFFFSGLSVNQKTEIVNQMVVYQCKKGQYVFKQGSPGTLFFIIKQGKIEIEINDKKIKNLGKNQYFGDLSLLYTAPRSASAKTAQDCLFWCLHQQDMRTYMKSQSQKNFKYAKPLIQKTPLFSFLTKKQINSLAYACIREKYSPNQIIFKKEDSANACYIIKEGQVQISIPGKDNIYLKQNQVFGENSLKVDEIRMGTATAGVQGATLISISRQRLNQAMGGKKLTQIRQFNILRWALIRSKIFKDISQQLIVKIFHQAQVQQFNDNQIIFKKKQLIQHFLIPIQGKINQNKAGTLINQQHLLEASKLGKNGRDNQYKYQYKQNIKKVVEGKIFMITFKSVQNILGYNIIKQLSEKQRLFVKNNDSNTDGQFIQVYMNNLKQFQGLNLSDLHYVDKLGEGQFGKVFLVSDKDDNKFALKCIKKKQIKQFGMQELIISQKKVFEEISNNPMIIKFYKSFKDEAFIYLLFQYVDGYDFFDTLRHIGLCSHTISKFYTACLIIALEQLHQNKIIYRDLKPQNAVIDSNGYLLLIDMGATKKLKEENGYRTFTVIGTPHYMAPEVIEGKGYSLEADIWSLGIVLYEMVCGQLPFGEGQEDSYNVYKIILKEKRIKFPNFLKNPIIKRFIERLVDINPNKRSQDIQTYKSDPFFDGLDWIQLYTKRVKAPYKPQKRNRKKQKKQQISKYLQKQIETNKIKLNNTVWDKQF